MLSVPQKICTAKLKTMKQKSCAYRKKVIPRKTLFVPVVLALLIISGCAALSKADCLHGDWYEIGLQDGKVGEPSERFNYYKDICSKFDVLPDIAKYSEGRTKGLEIFCTRTMGYSEGREGREYQNVCSGSSEELFLEGHSLGYRVHSTEEMVESFDQEMSLLSEQIETLETQIAELEDSYREGNFSNRSISDQLKVLRENLIETRDKIEPLKESRTDALSEYREAVDEANENGFLEAIDVANDNDFRDENASP